MNLYKWLHCRLLCMVIFFWTYPKKWDFNRNLFHLPNVICAYFGILKFPQKTPQSHNNCLKIVTCIHSNLEDIHDERRNYVNNELLAGQTTTQATNLIGGICEYCTRLGGYKANRMESTRPRGRVCGQGEIRRIKGGFVSLEAGSIRGCNVILANNRPSVWPYRADLPRAGTAITSGAERAARRAARRATTRAVSLEPQWVNELKTPHLSRIFTREQRNYMADVFCGFCR